MNNSLFIFRTAVVATCLLLFSGVKLLSAESDYKLSNDGAVLERYLGSEESIVVPDGVKKIDFDAFGFNSSLKSVVLPKSFAVAEGQLFPYCRLLESIEVAADNSQFRSIDGVLFSKDGKTLFYVPPKIKKDSYVVPDGVVDVRDGAFRDCASLSYVVFPKTIQTIGNYGFSGCSSLPSVDIPETVEFIGFGAFSDCVSLKAINVAKSNPQYCSIDGVLFSKDATITVDMPDGAETDAYVVPEGVKVIASSAFASCRRLKSIVLPETVEEIGDWAFFACSSLETLALPKNVEKIDTTAFDDCESLTSIDVDEDNPQFRSIDGVLFSKDEKTLILATKSMNKARYVVPETTERIISGAFDLCPSLEEIVLSENVREIESVAFFNCPSLTSIDVEENNPEFRSIDGVLFTKDGKTLVRYPAGREKASYSIPEGAESIGLAAFLNCSNLTEIVIPESVENIGEFAFGDCSSLASINLPQSVKEIGAAAFCRCFSLTSVKIPESVDVVANSAFESCDSLTKIIIPESVKSIDQFAFVGCSSLTSIIIPKSVEEIGLYAFRGCEKLTIRASKGSNAERFAKENRIKFEAIEQP